MSPASAPMISVWSESIPPADSKLLNAVLKLSLETLSTIVSPARAVEEVVPNVNKVGLLLKSA